MQAAFDSQDRSILQSWFKYLKLLKLAYDKLPDIDGDIWQVTLNNEDVRKRLSSDHLSPMYTALGAGMFSRSDIDNYRKQHSDKSFFATVLKDVKAKELGNFSVDKHKQALIFSGLKMNVMDSPSIGNMGLIIMHLKTSSKYSQCSVYKVSSVMKSFIRSCSTL